MARRGRALVRSVATPQATVAFLDDLEAAVELAAARHAPRTRIAYAKDLARFMAWRQARGRAEHPVDAADIAAYLGACLDAGHRASSITRYRAGLASRYPVATKTPEVAAVLAGIRRIAGTAPRRRAAFTIEQLRDAAEGLRREGSVRAVRDRAILLVAVAAGGLRRSELVALRVGDVQRADRGLLLTIRRAKTDQEAAGQERDIALGTTPHTCPVAAFEAWLAHHPAQDTPDAVLFRAVDRHGHVRGPLDARAIHALARRVAAELGLDVSEYGAHSLRASYATLAYRSGLPEVEVMRHGGWRSAQVMRRYVREAERWSVNFTAAVGL